MNWGIVSNIRNSPITNQISNINLRLQRMKTILPCSSQFLNTLITNRIWLSQNNSTCYRANNKTKISIKANYISSTSINNNNRKYQHTLIQIIKDQIKSNNQIKAFLKVWSG